MKIELQFLQDPYEPYEHENLAFSFWKRDIKTDTDKKKIVSMIHHLYHMCCVESGMDVKDLDEILKKRLVAGPFWNQVVVSSAYFPCPSQTRMVKRYGNCPKIFSANNSQIFSTEG